ncbi:phosphoribosylamine--glycine ligase [Fodinicurvata fenggangensis]|uniref:phosphoribosylamine--glycine ligase n=1 Tax=Fodinicurvata fenggangensis TaxID=1121830 RepID=UPI00047BD7A5|nr:phosphoribosylamine--glycine ligase [Fodinicurvata fenggangensis]
MRILVIGGGGREHALCWALARSSSCTALYCAPGNAGTKACAESVAIAAERVEELVDYARKQAIDLVVIGPEAPLVAGLADRLKAAGIAAFGPSASAARLEGSKAFMKDLCARHGIPTAAYGRFTDLEEARAHLHRQGAPIVVKADGLAAGKGVTVAMTLEEAETALEETLVSGRFGDAGGEVVIEEYLEGEEVSFFALCDGTTARPLASAQDHKRAYDGEAGPNTGGMGAYSPAPLMTDALQARVMAEIIEPTIAAMAAEGYPYQGVLYAGLMVTPEGEPRLLEYNVRFGDPECQILMLRLESDLAELLMATAQDRLANAEIRWRPESAITVVLAARGYPGSYAKGETIRGLDAAAAMEGVTLFHAGTSEGPDGSVLSAGGRVLNVCALGADLATARNRAYAAIARIDWPGGYYRRDIAWRALDW